MSYTHPQTDIVLTLLASGMTHQAIADGLRISPSAVSRIALANRDKVPGRRVDPIRWTKAMDAELRAMVDKPRDEVAKHFGCRASSVTERCRVLGIKRQAGPWLRPDEKPIDVDGNKYRALCEESSERLIAKIALHHPDVMVAAHRQGRLPKGVAARVGLS